MEPFDQEATDLMRQGLRPYLQDIEWFAVDQQGHVAAFVTAGFGVVPLDVFRQRLSFVDIHRQFSGLPESSKAVPVDGTYRRIDSFREFALRGMYVYDYNHRFGGYRPGMPYTRAYTPVSPLLAADSPCHDLLPRLPLLFAGTRSIVIEDEVAEVNVLR